MTEEKFWDKFNSMPRKTKRRLSLNQSANDVIPYSKVRVEWIDILSDSGWADEKGFNKMKQILTDYEPLLNAKVVEALPQEIIEVPKSKQKNKKAKKLPTVSNT